MGQKREKNNLERYNDRLHLLKIKRRLDKDKIQTQIVTDLRKEQDNIDRSVQFGCREMSCYSKMTSIREVFYQPIQKVFVSYNEKSVHVWNPITSRQLFQVEIREVTKSSYPIQSVVFYEKHWLYFVITNDFRLHVFNVNMIYLMTLPFGVRRISQAQIIESHDSVVTAGVSGLHIFKIGTNIPHGPKQMLLLDPLGETVKVTITLLMALPNAIEWITGMRWFSDSQVLAAWNNNLSGSTDSKETCFYTLKKNTSEIYEKQRAAMEEQDRLRQQGVPETIKKIAKEEFGSALQDEKDQCGEEENIVGQKEKANDPEIAEEKEEEGLGQITERMLRRQREEEYARNDPQELGLWNYYQDLVTHDDEITDILFCRRLLIFVVASRLGMTSVYKFGKGNNKLHEYLPVNKAVSSLEMHPRDQNYFIASSLDGNIRVYDLSRYEHIYTYEIGETCLYTRLIDSRLFVCFNSNFQLKAGQISHLAILYQYAYKAKIREIGRVFDNQSQKALCNPFMVYKRFRDNSIQFMRPEERSRNTMCIIYPPPKSRSIIAIQYCIYKKLAILLQDNGVLAFYDLTEITGKLVKLVGPNQIFDSQGKSIQEAITSFLVSHIQPTRFDQQNSLLWQDKQPLKREKRQVQEHISDSQSENNSIDSLQTDEEFYFEERWLYLGLKNGEVVVIDIDSTDFLYSRFVIENKHSIQQIVQQSDQAIFLTTSEVFCLKIWGFEEGKVQIFQSFDIFRPILSIKFSGDSLLMAHKDGDLILFSWEFKHQNQRELFHKTASKSLTGDQSKSENLAKFAESGFSLDNHGVSLENSKKCLFIVLPPFSDLDSSKAQNEVEEKVDTDLVAVDLHQRLGIYVTAFSHGPVKIYDQFFELQKQICFPGPVTCVQFVNTKGDFLVSHQDKISLVFIEEIFGDEMRLPVILSQDQIYAKWNQHREEVTWKTFAKLKIRNELAHDVKEHSQFWQHGKLVPLEEIMDEPITNKNDKIVQQKIIEKEKNDLVSLVQKELKEGQVDDIDNNRNLKDKNTEQQKVDKQFNAVTKRRRREIIKKIGEENKEIGHELLAKDLYNESIYKIEIKLQNNQSVKDTNKTKNVVQDQKSSQRSHQSNQNMLSLGIKETSKVEKQSQNSAQTVEEIGIANKDLTNVLQSESKSKNSSALKLKKVDSSSKANAIMNFLTEKMKPISNQISAEKKVILNSSEKIDTEQSHIANQNTSVARQKQQILPCQRPTLPPLAKTNKNQSLRSSLLNFELSPSIQSLGTNPTASQMQYQQHSTNLHHQHSISALHNNKSSSSDIMMTMEQVNEKGWRINSLHAFSQENNFAQLDHKRSNSVLSTALSKQNVLVGNKRGNRIFSHFKQSQLLSRQDMTQIRIQENIRRFNAPDGPTQSDSCVSLLLTTQARGGDKKLARNYKQNPDLASLSVQLLPQQEHRLNMMSSGGASDDEKEESGIGNLTPKDFMESKSVLKGLKEEKKGESGGVFATKVKQDNEHQLNFGEKSTGSLSRNAIVNLSHSNTVIPQKLFKNQPNEKKPTLANLAALHMPTESDEILIESRRGLPFTRSLIEDGPSQGVDLNNDQMNLFTKSSPQNSQNSPLNQRLLESKDLQIDDKKSQFLQQKSKDVSNTINLDANYSLLNRKAKEGIKQQVFPAINNHGSHTFNTLGLSTAAGISTQQRAEDRYQSQEIDLQNPSDQSIYRSLQQLKEHDLIDYQQKMMSLQNHNKSVLKINEPLRQKQQINQGYKQQKRASNFKESTRVNSVDLSIQNKHALLQRISLRQSIKQNLRLSNFKEKQGIKKFQEARNSCEFQPFQIDPLIMVKQLTKTQADIKFPNATDQNQLHIRKDTSDGVFKHYAYNNLDPIKPVYQLKAAKNDNNQPSKATIATKKQYVSVQMKNDLQAREGKNFSQNDKNIHNYYSSALKSPSIRFDTHEEDATRKSKLNKSEINGAHQWQSSSLIRSTNAPQPLQYADDPLIFSSQRRSSDAVNHQSFSNAYQVDQLKKQKLQQSNAAKTNYSNSQQQRQNGQEDLFLGNDVDKNSQSPMLLKPTAYAQNIKLQKQNFKDFKMKKKGGFEKGGIVVEKKESADQEERFVKNLQPYADDIVKLKRSWIDNKSKISAQHEQNSPNVARLITVTSQSNNSQNLVPKKPIYN